jgi:hypothetical protein
MEKINKIHKYICDANEPRIVLLSNKEVIQWLFDDHSFLPMIEKKNKSNDRKKLKPLEDKWGQTTLKLRRPDLTLEQQWTNKFGEHICEEICILLKKNPTKPKNMNHFEPDIETEDSIWEAKAGTYYTDGTAGEKILGTPFKYAEVPVLYNKPLKILCMGGAEKACRIQYGNLIGDKTTTQKKKFLEFFKENKIEYIAATDILSSFLD